MEKNEREIRLYRLWVAGVFDRPGAPPLPPNWCAHRVGTFWTIVGLMRSLAQPVRGGIDVQETRVSALLRAEILARGWTSAAGPLTPETFRHRVDVLQQAVPGAPITTVTAMTVVMSEDEAPYNPDALDESFTRIIESVHPEDIERFMARVAVTQRAFRLLPPMPAGVGLSFLSRCPPPTGIALSERAATGAAELCNEPLDRRFPHIFVYPRNLWEPLVVPAK